MGIHDHVYMYECVWGGWGGGGAHTVCISVGEGEGGSRYLRTSR